MCKKRGAKVHKNGFSNFAKKTMRSQGKRGGAIRKLFAVCHNPYPMVNLTRGLR